MNDPRSCIIWERDRQGAIEKYKASRRPNGQLRKKRERKGKPVPVTEVKKVVRSWQLYDEWIRH